MWRDLLCYPAPGLELILIPVWQKLFWRFHMDYTGWLPPTVVIKLSFAICFFISGCVCSSFPWAIVICLRTLIYRGLRTTNTQCYSISFCLVEYFIIHQRLYLASEFQRQYITLCLRRPNASFGVISEYCSDVTQTLKYLLGSGLIHLPLHYLSTALCKNKSGVIALDALLLVKGHSGFRQEGLCDVQKISRLK